MIATIISGLLGFLAALLVLAGLLSANLPLAAFGAAFGIVWAEALAARGRR